MENLKTGDVVRLKSFSPSMTIEKIKDNDIVLCKWFDKSDVKSAEFHKDMLEIEVEDISSDDDY